MSKKITIAIDGYSSTGKSTIAKQLAKVMGYVYVDSGAMYRAMTLFAMNKNYDKMQKHTKIIGNIHDRGINNIIYACQTHN